MRLLGSRQTRFEQSLKLKRLLRVARAVVNGEVTYYPRFVGEFEQRFAEFVDCRHGVSFCNGTSSIEAALFAVGVREGDEVLVPAHTFHASISPILNAGARPVFLDIDPRTQTLDPEEISRKVTAATRCIIVVHLFGNPADMGRISELVREHGLRVVEDCSHAHGASFAGAKVGSHGDVGCFSLQGDKSVSAGEGGIAVTNRRELRDRLCLFGHFGRRFEEPEGSHTELLETGVGYKRRANPLGICMAQVDLDHLDRRNAAKRQLAASLVEMLEKLDGVSSVKSHPDAQRGGFYPGLPVVLDESVARSLSAGELVQRLRGSGVAAAPFPYSGYHRMRHMIDPAYRRALLFGVEPGPALAIPSLPATDAAQERTFFLPLPEFGGAGLVARTEAALSQALASPEPE